MYSIRTPSTCSAGRLSAHAARCRGGPSINSTYLGNADRVHAVHRDGRLARCPASGRAAGNADAGGVAQHALRIVTSAVLLLDAIAIIVVTTLVAQRRANPICHVISPWAPIWLDDILRLYYNTHHTHTHTILHAAIHLSLFPICDPHRPWRTAPLPAHEAAAAGPRARPRAAAGRLTGSAAGWGISRTTRPSEGVRGICGYLWGLFYRTELTGDPMGYSTNPFFVKPQLKHASSSASGSASAAPSPIKSRPNSRASMDSHGGTAGIRAGMGSMDVLGGDWRGAGSASASASGLPSGKSSKGISGKSVRGQRDTTDHTARLMLYVSSPAGPLHPLAPQPDDRLHPLPLQHLGRLPPLARGQHGRPLPLGHPVFAQHVRVRIRHRRAAHAHPLVPRCTAEQRPGARDEPHGPGAEGGPRRVACGVGTRGRRGSLHARAD